MSQRIQKPLLFIGSSVEGLEIARHVQSEFSHECDASVWNHEFPVGDTTYESLEAALNKFQCAIFVLTPDDELCRRGTTKKAPRDNVLFESGLFLGRHSRRRTFILMPRGEDMFLPSDLNGVTQATYDPHANNLRASVGAACNEIRPQLSSASFSANKRDHEYCVRSFVFRIALKKGRGVHKKASAKEIPFEMSVEFSGCVELSKPQATVKTFGLRDVERWDSCGDRVVDLWQLGQNRVQRPGDELDRRTYELRERDLLLYRYAYRFRQLPCIEDLFDSHVFSFFADSARIEFDLPSEYAPSLNSGTHLRTESVQISDTRTRWVCFENRDWTPGEKIDWRIALNKC